MSDPHKKKSVLLIEDHAGSCQALKQMLRRRGLHAECAESFREGMTALDVAGRQGNPFSCLVCDLSLTDSTALQTVERLQRVAEEMPVRAISGTQDPEVIEACRLAGIALILKGTSAEGIMESVLYAISESAPDPEIFEMIADNRERKRELTPGMFASWSRLMKIVTAIGVIIGTTTATLTLGGWLYHKLEERVVQTQSQQVNTAELLALKSNQVLIETRTRSLEDNNIKIVQKLDELARTTERIEKKVDRQPQPR